MLEWTRSLFRARTRADAQAHAPLEPFDFTTTPPAPRGGNDTVDPARPIHTGMVLAGRYRLDVIIGRGGTGVVHRATDLVRGEDVAVKVLVRYDPGGRQAPAVESTVDATIALRLSHPCIARVHHVDRHGSWPFVVMEYVSGADLHRHARMRRERRLPLDEVMRIGASVLDALAYAHERGVIHNDVKPSNLLLDRTGAVKLCDFGLARLAESSPGAWLSGSSLGAPGFMSPERIRGEAPDERSDLYSLAASLYALAVGQPPWGVELAQAWRGHLELPPPPSKHIPEPLFDVLRTALEKDPALRFAHAREMKAALAAVVPMVERPAPEAGPMGQREARGERPASQLHRRPAPARPSTSTHSLPSSLTPHRRPAPLPAGALRVPARRLLSRHGGEHDVASFLVSRAPVTNAEWRRFLEATGEAPPLHWLGGKPPRHMEDAPVVGVSLDAARRFAEWCELRLLSDVEWEAARAAGVLERVGEVWEWTEPRRAAHAPDDGYAWVFGGSSRHPSSQAEDVPRSAVAVDKDYLYLGFRCARDDDDDGRRGG